MATVTSYTAARMQEIEDSAIVDGNVEAGHLILVRHDTSEIDAGSVIGPTGPQGPPGTDPSIVVCTSGTRPSGGDLYEGLVIYETDTDKLYVYNGAWVVIIPPKLPKGFGVGTIAATSDVSSTTGVEWDASSPLDVTFTKIGSAAETNILVRIAWSAYTITGGWGNTWGGVKLAGATTWGQVAHQINTPSQHMEFTDALWLVGLAAGSKTLRAMTKITAGGNAMRFDVADYFRIEYEEVAY